MEKEGEFGDESCPDRGVRTRAAVFDTAQYNWALMSRLRS
jgi:hypothetical protein